MYRWILLVVLACCLHSALCAQTNDNILWAGVKAQKKLSDKTSIFLVPIVRVNEDISAYQNTSIELAIKHKFGKGWSAQLLERTWFVPNQTFRQFIWTDVAYSKAFEKFKVSSSLRFHLALDVKDRVDPDFIRWKTVVSWQAFENISVFAAIEPWLRLNKFDQLQRIRYEPGIKYSFSDLIKFQLIYRREESLNLSPLINVNMLVPTLIFDF